MKDFLGQSLIYGLVWSLFWIVYVYIIVKFFPWGMLHDYPKDIQTAATIKEPTAGQQRTSKLFTGVGGILIICAPILWGIVQFSQERTTFLILLGFIFIIVMMWNVIDLLIMDWLIFVHSLPIAATISVFLRNAMRHFSEKISLVL